MSQITEIAREKTQEFHYIPYQAPVYPPSQVFKSAVSTNGFEYQSQPVLQPQTLKPPVQPQPAA